MDDSLAAIAARIELARTRAGMTQKQLGLAIGLGERQVRYYENATTPPYKKLDEIAMATGTTREWLLGLDPRVEIEQLKAELAGQSQMIELLLEAIRPGWRELLRPPGALAPPDEVGPNNGSSHDEARND